MKHVTYTIATLAALPQLCTGHGSLRISSNLIQLANDADKQASVSLDDLFKELGLRQGPNNGDTGEDPDDISDKEFNEPAYQTDDEKKKTERARDDATKKSHEIIGNKIDTMATTMTELKEAADSNGSWGGKGEAVQVGLDSIKSSIDIFNKCNGPNGCEPKEAADAVFAVLGAVGFVVGVFFPPAGAVIAVMAAVGSFVASFFGDEPVRAMPGLDAAAVEAAAFRAVKKVEDTGTFAEFADFASVLRTATKFNSDILQGLEDVNRTQYNQNGPKDAQEAVDKIIDVWFDQYHQYKWVDLLSRMKDSGKAYVSAFGDITGSRRGVFADWAKDSKKTCKLEYYLEMNQKGRDNLNTCKKNMATAKTNYDYVQNFGLNYIKVATMLTEFHFVALKIFTMHSTCGNEVNKRSCDYYIAYKSLKYDVEESMTKHSNKLKVTLKELNTKCEAPASNLALWPWNQKCEDWPGKCNYDLLLFTTQTDQEATVNKCEGGGCKLVIEEQEPRDISGSCKEVLRINRNTTKGKAFNGGIFVWHSSDSDKPKDYSKDYRDSNNGDQICPKIAKGFREASLGHDVSIFAIPGYSLDIPKCVELFQDSQNFGIVNAGVTGTTETPTSAPTMCRTNFYSILGGRGDQACWQEPIKACSLDAARKLIDGHNWKAAKRLGWSSGWSSSSGGNWNGGVKKETCIQRGFSKDEEVQCFWGEILNEGCMYD